MAPPDPAGHASLYFTRACRHNCLMEQIRGFRDSKCPVEIKTRQTSDRSRTRKKSTPNNFIKIQQSPGKKQTKHPDHTWTVDLTTVPTAGGFWTSWLPNSLPQCWPFCYWMAVIVDHFSRKSVGFALFRKQPTSGDVRAALERAVKITGKAPKYIISDKGVQFFCDDYKDWCRVNNVKPRFGAVGKHGSIAITERFIKSLKYECTKIISVPMNFDEMRHELALYFTWYNEFRPHEYLGARTPQEVYSNSPPLKMTEFRKGSDIPEMKLEL